MSSDPTATEKRAFFPMARRPHQWFLRTDEFDTYLHGSCNVGAHSRFDRRSICSNRAITTSYFGMGPLARRRERVGFLKTFSVRKRSGNASALTEAHRRASLSQEKYSHPTVYGTCARGDSISAHDCACVRTGDKAQNSPRLLPGTNVPKTGERGRQWGRAPGRSHRFALWRKDRAAQAENRVGSTRMKRSTQRLPMVSAEPAPGTGYNARSPVSAGAGAAVWVMSGR